MPMLAYDCESCCYFFVWLDGVKTFLSAILSTLVYMFNGDVSLISSIVS